jgi:hypothetical protein
LLSNLPLSQPPPEVCSGTAQFLDSLDFTTKLGVEAEVTSSVKVGVDLFKNNQTGEKGGEIAARPLDYRYVVPSYASMNSEAGTHVLTIDLGFWRYSSQTGWGSGSLSKFLTFGAVAGIGGDISFNSERAKQISQQCGGQ